MRDFSQPMYPSMLPSPANPGGSGLDLLEVKRTEYTPTAEDYANDNINLLRAIARELRRLHPDIRCVIDLQFSNAAKILDSNVDFVNVKFLNKGNPVKSMLAIVTNSTDLRISVGVNEPVLSTATIGIGSGITLPPATVGTNFIELPVEVQNLQIRINTTATGQAVAVNNSAAYGAHGGISILAWTIPEDESS